MNIKVYYTMADVALYKQRHWHTVENIDLLIFLAYFIFVAQQLNGTALKQITTTTKNRSKMKAQTCSLFPIGSLSDLQNN